MRNIKKPNTACTRSPQEQRGWRGGSRRVFRQFVWLGVGSGKMALSRPAHQRVPRRTMRGRPPAVGRQPRESITEETRGCGEEGFTRMKHIIEAIALGTFKNWRLTWQILKLKPR